MEKKPIEAQLDHVAMGTLEGGMKLAKFYTEVIGFEPLKFEEYERGEAPFPSVRINDGTILDFFDPKPCAENPHGSCGTALSKSTHMCFALSRQTCDAVVARLKEAGVTVSSTKKRFGARGDGISVYCVDPEGNNLEFRYYP